MLKRGTFAPVHDMIGGGNYDLLPGAWTDDTAMALCLAESLIEHRDFDPHDQVARYTAWQQQGYMSASGQCVGITASVSRALAAAKWRRQAFAGSHDPSQLDPEPLARVAPVVMFPCRVGVRWVDRVAVLGERLEPGGAATWAGWLVLVGGVGVVAALGSGKNRPPDGGAPPDR